MSQTNREYQGRGLGQKGYVLIQDTSAHTGNFFALHASGADVVVSAGTEANGSTVAQTIDQGDTIYGVFTSVTRGSGGNLIAYNA